MRTIKVEIDCSDKYCSGCNFNPIPDECDVWNIGLRYDDGYLRCKQCLDAEIKEPIITTGYMQIDEEVK